tara:strand:- start:1156 stop:1554 length:399 start_codon:yes stop_codon:yes gene_type:complete
MNYQFSQRSFTNMAGVRPELIEIALQAIQMSPIDFGIPSSGGLRTAEEQKALFVNGKSKCDGEVKKSYHQSGNALDFYAYVDGAASWKEEHLAIVAAAFLQAAIELGYTLEWGGLWKGFRDMPHVQMPEDDG